MDTPPIAEFCRDPRNLAWIRQSIDFWCDNEMASRRSPPPVFGKGVAEILSTPGAVGSGVRKARRVRERPLTAKNTATGEGPMLRRGVSS